MECEQRAIRLDQINLPAEHPRTAYSPAGYRRLKESIGRLGVLVPVLVRKLGSASWVRLEPIRGGARAEIHWDRRDAPERLCRELPGILGSMPEASGQRSPS